MIFIDLPGAHERHLQRKYNNPDLFSIKQADITNEMVQLARKDDADELEDFMRSFQKVVERAVSLKPNEQSDVILKLKEELDQHYEKCCSLQGDLSKIKIALVQLVNAIMGAVQAAAGNDVVAQQKLEEEVIARNEHYRIQEFPFIADMMREDNPVPASEFSLSLISEPMNVVAEALVLFSAEQLSAIISDLHDHFEKLDDETIAPYQEKIEAISSRLTSFANTENQN